MKMNELLPCPFCGSTDINTEGPCYDQFMCNGCGVSQYDQPGHDEAVAAWNRRATPQAHEPDGAGDNLESLGRFVDRLLADSGEMYQRWLRDNCPQLASPQPTQSAKAEPVAVTDEMVERGLAQYSEGGCMGLDQRERREVVTDILTAALGAP